MEEGSLLSLLRPKDGQPSNTSGPCKCGKKHYLEGIEYDYIFTIMTSRGPLMLGYNADDNPYIAAQSFIDKYKLNEHSLDDTKIRNAIADEILKNTESTAPVTGEHGLRTPKKDKNAVDFDPYKSTVAVPKSGVYYNKTTGKWEAKIYDPILKVAEDAERDRAKQASQNRYKQVQQEKETQKKKFKNKWNRIKAKDKPIKK